MALGTKIREALKQKGMTQRRLAQELGVAPAAVGQWIRGQTQPNQSNTEKIEEILDVPLRIGNWVRRKRTERQRQMSVAELSEKSGVSMPTIYNIESGKIQNPQDKTVAKLAAAFGDQVPEEVRETSAEVSRIEGLGAIQDFSPHERDEWPEVAGVYLLYDISDRLIYIGESGNIKRRLREHEQKFWFKSPIVERSSYIEIGDEHLRRQVEGILIRSLRSHAVINYQGVQR